MICPLQTWAQIGQAWKIVRDYPFKQGDFASSRPCSMDVQFTSILVNRPHPTKIVIIYFKTRIMTQVYYSVHCPKNNLNIGIKTKAVTDGAEGIVLSTVCTCMVYMPDILYGHKPYRLSLTLVHPRQARFSCSVGQCRTLIQPNTCFAAGTM